MELPGTGCLSIYSKINMCTGSKIKRVYQRFLGPHVKIRIILQSVVIYFSVSIMDICNKTYFFASLSFNMTVLNWRKSYYLLLAELTLSIFQQNHFLHKHRVRFM